jgi:L-aspartate-alpha-decarboxylase
MLKSKLHNATVTGAEPEYEGSLMIDSLLMEAVKLRPYEKILVANLANGNRFETYVIKGEPGSGTICLNGATCFLGSKGDRVIIFSFCSVTEEEAGYHHPLILVLDKNNKPNGPLKQT